VRGRTPSIAMFACLAVVGCLPAVYPSADMDGDGYFADVDCGPEDPTIHPGASDPFGDAIDQNCDGLDGVDADGDGVDVSVDCDPDDPTIFPGAPDGYGDDVDQDCDECDGVGGDGIDRDCDGFPANIDVDESLFDCADDDPAVNPGAVEQCNDVDDDCSGVVDDGWDCLPGDCGERTWGNLPVGVETLYVDLEAAPGGDCGSAEAACTSIQDALDQAAGMPGTLIAVAAGLYAENLVIDDSHDGTWLAGRCREQVAIDGSVGVELPGVLVEGTGATGVTISGFTLRGGQPGLQVAGGTVAMHYMLVDDSVGAGLWVPGPAFLSIEQARIEDTVPAAEASEGYGLVAAGGADVDLVNVTFEDNAVTAILAGGEQTSVYIHLADVLGTTAAYQVAGPAIDVYGGAYLDADSMTLSGNAGCALLVEDAGTEASIGSIEIYDTATALDGTGGQGIRVEAGAGLWASNVIMDSNSGYAVGASGPDSYLQLNMSFISNTAVDADGAVAPAVLAQDGARVEIDGLTSDDTEGPGVAALNGASLHCYDCDLDASQFAAAVVEGASLSLDSCRIDGVVGSAHLGGGIGVYARDDGGAVELILEGSTLEGATCTGVFLSGGGSYDLSENEIEGVSDGQHQCGDGLLASGGVGADDLHLSGNTFHAAGRAGVLLDGSSATLSGNTYTDNAVDLVWQGCDGVEEPVGYEEASTTEICSGADYLVQPFDFTLEI
jgi:hypothetical protein